MVAHNHNSRTKCMPNMRTVLLALTWQHRCVYIGMYNRRWQCSGSQGDMKHESKTIFRQQTLPWCRTDNYSNKQVWSQMAWLEPQPTCLTKWFFTRKRQLTQTPHWPHCLKDFINTDNEYFTWGTYGDDRRHKWALQKSAILTFHMHTIYLAWNFSEHTIPPGFT